MEVERLADGLWRWTAPHPDWDASEGWDRDVACVYYEAADAIVLVDPLVPAGEDEVPFWKALDRDVRRARLPVHVLITIFWHVRSAAAVMARYDARLWAPSRARAPIERRTGKVTDVFRPGDALPGGVESFASGRRTEVVFWIPAHRTLVPGDAILGANGGGLRLCSASWLPRGVGPEKLRATMRPLLELPVERVLVSHGDPVLSGGREALAEILS